MVQINQEDFIDDREKRQTICKLPGMWQAPDEMSGTMQYRYNLWKVQQGDCCHCGRRESYGSGKPENSREERESRTGKNQCPEEKGSAENRSAEKSCKLLRKLNN